MNTADSFQKLRDAIKKTIKSQVNGEMGIDQTREEYGKLFSRYRDLERKYISDHSKGYLKGVLYHHNIQNHSLLTAIFDMKGGDADPVIFTGDQLLLAALPEMISRLYSDANKMDIFTVPMGREETTGHALSFIKSELFNGRFCIATVSASPEFNNERFLLCAQYLLNIIGEHYNFNSAVSISYINAISREMGRLIEINRGDTLLADHFILEKIADSFEHIGIKKLINICEFIVNRLEDIYPDTVHIVVLSLSHFAAIYNKDTVFDEGFKPNRIDFEYMDNNIPYRITQSEIRSPESVHYYQND